jgi:hypothetical protein
LRQHSASVASTTSNSSAAPANYVSETGDFSNYASTYPILTRTDRSGSNASAAAAQLPNIPVTSRYDEVAQQRLELDAAKRENERLRDRVKELEARLRERRSSLSRNSTNFSITPNNWAASCYFEYHYAKVTQFKDCWCVASHWDILHVEPSAIRSRLGNLI